jgi:signal transduction histidine kinase
VSVERAELEQIILNLAANARDAMPDGGRITLRTSDFEPLPALDHVPNGYVRLTVEDEGVGMSPDTQTQIFEPFFTTKSDGTGLGLSTVLDVVRRNQGHVSVESVENQGSRFEVCLPRRVPAGAPAIPEPLNPPNSSTRLSEARLSLAGNGVAAVLEKERA